MDVNGINSANLNIYGKAQSLKTQITTKEAFENGSKNEASVAKADTFVKGESTQSVTYRAPKKLSSKQIEDIKNQQSENMKNFVGQMLGGQIKHSVLSVGGADISSILGADDTPETAAAAIADDGEWGVGAVATRLLDMAVALSGGDTSKISMLREAVEKGFKAAGAQFGTDLPQVCQDTYAETMKRFDYWEENGSLEGYNMQEKES